MLRKIALAVLVSALIPAVVPAADFDPYLHQKANDYETFLREWHSTGLGGVSDILFTDGTRQEIFRTVGSGDSGDWTGFYLTTQALRYMVTGEALAREEILRIAHYMHILHDITGHPGYIARYAGIDEAPWNVESMGGDNRYDGTGDYEDYFWLGHNVRDKYITWFWGLTWAYDALRDDPEDDAAAMRQTIREDFVEMVEALDAQNWIIIDPWGDTYSAAEILPDIRLEILVQAAHVTDDPDIAQLRDDEYERNKTYMWLSTFSWFNKYFDYYAFINNHPVWQAIFRLWPDRERGEHLRRIWEVNVRYNVVNTHAAFFDAVWYAQCVRFGGCDEDEIDAVRDDVIHGLTVMNEAPNYRRAVECPVLPLDPFSVWADDLLNTYPWIEQLTGFDIDPQTAEAHQVENRCWESHLWERSPYHVECTGEENPAETGPGLDYLIAYWFGVYYGLLPGDGPYGDDDLIEPTDDDADDDADDDTTDDDSADDDVVDDDADDDDGDDDDSADDDVDDDVNDDTDDDVSDEASAESDDDGCGC
ncbi:MAG: hypothetical protein KJ042_06870 [Deltaproteobacteria bacterium]|nr:hypothetical protein [Deltaproteobacteria bacterium]